jgi:hypothetical protein
MPPRTKKKPAGIAAPQSRSRDALLRILQSAPVQDTLIRHMYDGMAREPEVTMEELTQWWPEMASAVHQYANGGWLSQDGIQDPDAATQGLGSHGGEAPAAQLQHSPPIEQPNKLRRMTSTADLQESWRPGSLMDYFSPSRTKSSASNGVAAASSSADAPRAAVDTAPCIIRIDE